ncbi:MAG TPA: hypothetical protein VFY10_12335 [Dehalococcoidia bacterium]|nr:hypothetical protein [Dehalococcoidia bacterium]
MRKTYEEMVQEAEAFKDTDREIEGLVPVKANVSKNPRSVFSVRLNFGELGRIEEAAKARGLTISEFMRQASLAAANGEQDLAPGEHTAAVLAVREKARDLYNAVEKLQ